MDSYPRDDLIRMNTGIRAEEGEDGQRVLVGTPVVFNEWAEIDSWEGRFREQIDPKALNRTLKERGDRIKVLFNHGFDPQIGQKPLGKPSVQDIRKDALHVEVPLVDTSYNSDIIALLDAEALDGMSFRFDVVAESWAHLDDEEKMSERTITELRLLEYGPVTFPAYAATTVGARSAREFEEYRMRLTSLAAITAPVTTGTILVDESGPAPEGRSAESNPGQSQLDTQNEISHLIREIDLCIKGIKS